MLRAKSALMTLGTISILALSACAPKNDGSSASTSPKVSLTAIEKDSKLSAAAKAEALSQLAARLVTPTSFMKAYEIAGRALAQDPSNARAKFIKGILAPQMELKGIVKRVALLVSRHPKLQKDYANLVASVKATHDSGLKSFALSGPMDIGTERELQDVIAQYTARLDDFRKTLGEMKGTEFSLKINTSSQKPGAKVDDCHITENAGEFDFSQCDESMSIERTVNQADIEMMKQYVAYEQVYFTVLNSYDASGTLEIAGTHMTPKQAYEGILRNAQAGKLRTTNGIGVLPSIAKDAVVGARWALQNQRELCATGEESDMNRPGNLFPRGACLKSDDKTESVLRKIEIALQGSAVQIPFGSDEVTVFPEQLFSNPVQDLRTQPVTFNACGEVESIGDGKLNGAFPFGDLNKVLKTSSNCQK